jgi:hypothetical protein
MAEAAIDPGVVWVNPQRLDTISLHDPAALRPLFIETTEFDTYILEEKI